MLELASGVVAHLHKAQNKRHLQSNGSHQAVSSHTNSFSEVKLKNLKWITHNAIQ